MYVVTADQIASRTTSDLVSAELDRIGAVHGGALALPADRTAGDELQALAPDAATALELCLELTRNRLFHVGLGIGQVRTPLPSATREASGPAFFAARDAVGRAKRTGTRLAIQLQANPDVSPQPAEDAEALLGLLLIVRDRRSEPGWELFDLLKTGLSQAEAAAQLRISAPAASARAKAAHIRAELAATPALIRILEQTDRATSQEAS